MNFKNVEQLNSALNDEGLQAKNLGVKEYMSTLKLSKKISVFLDDIGKDIDALVNAYNKDFKAIVKSEKFKAATKKEASELTQEDTDLLKTKPTVTFRDGLIFGPEDFIEKINKIKEGELKLAKTDLNFINDEKVFKAFVENAKSDSQLILYKFLFKNE